MTYHFIKYNKFIYMLYAFIIMLLFNTYSTISYCKEGVIEEEFEKTASNNDYLYYTLTILASITAICVTYTITAYYFPDLDILNLFNKNEALSNFGLDSMIYSNILENNIIERYTLHKTIDTKNTTILVDKDTFDFITSALKTKVEESTQLKETITFQEQQINNLNKLIGLISEDINQHPFRRNSI